MHLRRNCRHGCGRRRACWLRTCAAGYLTIVDGPLNFVRSRDLPVVGYVKTHHRPKDDLERASIGCPAEHVVGRIELIQREVVGEEPRHSPACQSRQYRQVLTPGLASAAGPDGGGAVECGPNEVGL